MAKRSKKNSKRRRKAARQAQNSTTAVRVRESTRNGEPTNGAPKFFTPEPPQVFNPSDWAGVGGDIGEYITEATAKTLKAYVDDPVRLNEDARAERSWFRGGYAKRQLVELVQNSADALKHNGGRIAIRVTDHYLYCADEGTPITKTGVESLKGAHLSPKQGTEFIGQFGLGFKSVLAVTDAPEFFSRSGAFIFDRGRAEQRIHERIAGNHLCPVLRLPEPVDPIKHSEGDAILREMMSWATNIVRLPLNSDAYQRLQPQMREFRPECLFFTPGVSRLTLVDNAGDWSADYSVTQHARELSLESKGSDRETTKETWKLYSKKVRMSAEARTQYQFDLGDEDEIEVSWAVPIGQWTEPSRFWTYFPTTRSCLVAGIVNARWQTYDDRQGLHDGLFNDELIEAAAELISANLHQLQSDADPALHLDALPKRPDDGDDLHAAKLRLRLFQLLHGSPIVPDLQGNLQPHDAIRYPPSVGTVEQTRVAYDQWFAVNRRDTRWLHPQALRNTERFARVERLCDENGIPPNQRGSGAPRASIAEWLEVLVDGVAEDEAVEASKSAIRIAAELPTPSGTFESRNYGKIILTSNGDFASVAGWLYLPTEDDVEWDGHVAVHPELADDQSTRAALKEIGVQEASDEARFDSSLNAHSWGEKQWRLSRKLAEPDVAASKIKQKDDWQSKLCLKTISGDWWPCHSVLLPGVVVPDDTSRDAHVAVDLVFHSADKALIERLGMSDRPQDGWDLGTETSYKSHLNSQRPKFVEWACSEGKSKPQSDRVKFLTPTGIGPVDVLEYLSEPGRGAYTHSVLNENALANKWKIGHESPNRNSYYGTLEVNQPIIPTLLEHGRIQTSAGIVPFADALGENPKSREAQRLLLDHQNAELIRSAFDLHDAHSVRPANFEPAEPILEVWPGLQPYLSQDQTALGISRCQWFEDDYGLRVEERSALIENVIYLSRMDDIDELSEVCSVLHVSLDEDILYAVLDQPTPREIEDARNEVANQPDDSHRLLKAVGDSNLRSELPNSLIAYYERNGTVMSGAELAGAAIATYHTGALKQYRRFLEHLNPPKRWTSGPGTVDFVRSLGFSAEWAGDPNSMPDPFIEIPGPFDLPEEHDYQRIIIDKLRKMLAQPNLPNVGRRGLISLPTGSGKTRVAVQGIVEAMKNGRFEGGVLWVANRDELCEQAVESWQQVWSAIGAERTVLRVSRMWGGQKRPAATNERHVVVATIQTLLQRMVKRSQGYEFLRDFSLIVFDEAHGSIAPSFNAVLREIGFGRVQRPDDPFLLGLTATPYRGRNEPETRWLVNRYDGNRLDNDVFRSNDASEVVKELQRREILAYVDHEVILGGDYSVSAAEVATARGLPWLDPQTELRIALDAVRTDRIIEEYERLVWHRNPDWPTLIFAISVDHAKGLAAILNGRGISARAVWSDTERYTRRQIVEQFRAGDLKVLVNYGVFREGFDAPKTRAIIVARPVFSPNTYFQMIGRGLRGIENGGNERCLILDVNDNIENFDRELAFNEMDWLWD